MKNLKIVEIEISTRFKFSKLSRSRLARDSKFQNCRDRDLCETHNLWIVEIEIRSRPQFSGLSRLRFVETGQKLSRSRFFRDSRWSLRHQNKDNHDKCSQDTCCQDKCHYDSYLPLNFGWNLICNRWDISDIDKCRPDKCGLDKCHHDSWNPLKMDRETNI